MSYSVLIVDDEIVIREGLKQVVSWEDIGFSVIGAVSSGEEALRVIETTDVDVVFTDIHMPRISGIELARLIHVNHPDIRVVILSGYDYFSYAQKAIRYGVYHYLLKPCAEEEVVDVFTRLKGELDTQREHEMSVKMLGKHLVQEQLSDLISAKISLEDAPELSEWVYSHIPFYIVLLQIAPDEKLFISALQDKEFFGSLKEFSVPDLFKAIDVEDVGLIASSGHYRFFCLVKKEKGVKDPVQKWFYAIRDRIRSDTHFDLVGSYCMVSEEVVIRQQLFYKIRGIENILLWHIDYGCLKEFDCRKIDHYTTNLISLPNPEVLAKILCDPKIYQKDSSDKDGIFTQTDSVYVTDPAEWMRTFSDALERFVERTTGDSSRITQFIKSVLPLVSCCLSGQMIKEICMKMGYIACNAISDHKSNCYSKNIRDALDLIDRKYKNNISLEELARELGLTSTYLSKLFKREVGIKFKEYILQKQMDEAKRLLRETNDKIYEIAEAVGFSDQHYFSDVFKRMTSLTPLEYRKVGVDA
ncbi:MAG: response regulator transcription factor [Sphaerochaetaceae bacterium]